MVGMVHELQRVQGGGESGPEVTHDQSLKVYRQYSWLYRLCQHQYVAFKCCGLTVWLWRESFSRVLRKIRIPEGWVDFPTVVLGF